MLDQLVVLWAVGCLIALFGIWLCLYTRLPRAKPAEKPLSKKEKAELAEQERIEAAARRLLAKQGLIEDEPETKEQTLPQSPKLNRAAQIQEKYGVKK